MANEFTRIAHATSGTTAVDINSSKSNTGNIPGLCTIAAGSGGIVSYIPVSAYSKVAFVVKGTNLSVPFRWVYEDDTESADIASIVRDTWTSYYDIPSNAKCVKLTATYTGTTQVPIYLSLLS